MTLDKFYTKPEVATECIKHIPNIGSYDLIVEPSAGSGNFAYQLKGCLAYDIAPEGEGIIEKDYFTLTREELPTYSKMLVVGNPPFGQRSSLAKAFIKHSIELGATTIAFILPNTFNKLTNQKVFPDNWRLEVYYALEGTNFTADGDDYYVPCSFYVWTCEPGTIDLRDHTVEQVPEFSFCPRGSLDAHFALNGNNGKIKDLADITNPKAEHYIKVNEGYDVQDIRNRLGNIQYNFNSSVNGNNAWLGQQDILKAYRSAYY